MLSLDNHPHIHTVEDNVQNLFQKITQSKVVIDMGCGHGDYMLAHCKDDVDMFWIGIDISRKRAIKTEGRLLKVGIENFMLFADDGQDVLTTIPSNSVDIIHINFPDPWLREKQWKNRLFRPSFLTDIVRILKQGGELSFVTDIRQYADSVAHILSLFPAWESLFNPVVKENIFESFPTLFYRKMSPLRPISYIRFIKK